MPMAAHVAAGMHWGVHGVPYHAESTLSSAQVLKGRIGEPHGRTIYDHVDVCALHPGSVSRRHFRGASSAVTHDPCRALSSTPCSRVQHTLGVWVPLGGCSRNKGVSRHRARDGATALSCKAILFATADTTGNGGPAVRREDCGAAEP